MCYPLAAGASRRLVSRPCRIYRSRVIRDICPPDVNNTGGLFLFRIGCVRESPAQVRFVAGLPVALRCADPVRLRHRWLARRQVLFGR